jgi:hypothetical protein
MILQLTDYAVGVLATNPSPTLDVFKIGSASGYVPLPTDTDIHGSIQFTGQVAPPVTLNANVVKYVISMDSTVGDFSYGEVGFMYQGQLFALAVADTLSFKRKTGADPGNIVRFDAYLTVVGANYAMVVDEADSSNQFMMAGLSTIDQLPPVNNTLPNSYIISGASSDQSTFMAYTDRTGLWSFDAYQFGNTIPATVVSADILSVTIALADYSADMNPAFFGQVALQFGTGLNFSICRYVKTAIQSGQTVTLGFQTPMAIVPSAGDKIRVYRRVDGASGLQLPIATASLLGGIKIGTGLVINPTTGVCSVDPAALGAVTSVNGKTGAVTLTAPDIPGIATVGKTGSYNDLTDKPAPYSLPIATTTVLGGVKAPANGNLTINGSGVIDLGFTPIKTVNGVGPDASGNINVVSNEIGLVDPQAVVSNADLNNYTTTGLFTIAAGLSTNLVNAPTNTGEVATLEVVPTVLNGTGYSVQRYITATGMWWRAGVGNSWGAWNAVSTQAIATTSSLGVVQIGSGLSITAQGVLSWNSSALPVASASTLGVIRVGSGLSIDGSGILSATATPYTLPIASAGTLGGIRVGAGLSIDGSGILKASVQTVNGAGPDANGNIVVTSDSNKLDRVNGTATGVYLTFVDLGTKASGSLVTVAASAANVQRAQFTGGNVSWTFTWPASGTYAEVQLEIQNGGLATHTFPAALKWVNPDGTFTTAFATYMNNRRAGQSNFQTSGIDFAIMWTRDGGTNIYAVIL